MSTPGKDGYSHDTGAIRDVANNDMASIAQDIGRARGRFGHTMPDASEAFRCGPSAIAFVSLNAKWVKATEGIDDGMERSEARVEVAAEALRKTADDYDGVDSQAAADFEGLLQSLRER